MPATPGVAAPRIVRWVAKNDLQEFFLVGVGVPQQANFLKQLHGHQVGFVDQQDRGAALLLRLEEHLVQRCEPPRLAGGGAGDLVLVEDRFQ